MRQGESVATKLRKVAKVSENFAKGATYLAKFQKFGEAAPKIEYVQILHLLAGPSSRWTTNVYLLKCLIILNTSCDAVLSCFIAVIGEIFN